DSFVPTPAPVTAAVEVAFKALTDAGATLVDLDALGYNFSGGPGELLVLCYDFRNDVKAYFATRVGVPVAGGTLTDAIAFNSAHADVEMPYFNQDRSEEHTSELQSRGHLVCRLLLEKKKKPVRLTHTTT